MWGRVELKAMVIVPYDRLHGERQGAQVALMSDGSNKLQGNIALALQE